MIIYLIISYLLIFFLVFPFLTVLFSRFTKERGLPKTAIKQFDFGSIITAYRNADIAKPLVESLLKQNYDNHLIYLVADNADIANWDIHDDRVRVFRPEPALNLKAKSIIYGIEHFRRNHDYIVIFDADNLAHPDFLKEINRYANRGDVAIQGQRTAKNLDTMYACADSTGEFYKNFVERLVPYLIGSSSVISGSGMAVESNLYKAYLNSPEIQQGQHLWKKMLQEDKILQNNLLDKNTKITYAWDAIVYDEKVTSADAVETQRSRWLFSYFQNMKNSSRILLKGLFGFSWNQFLFGVITISPPLFILLGLSGLMAVIGLIIKPFVGFALIAATGIFILNIFWSLYLSRVPKEIWGAIGGMPLFVWRQVRALFKMGNPNKNFKHSEHTRHVSIDEVLKK